MPNHTHQAQLMVIGEPGRGRAHAIKQAVIAELHADLGRAAADTLIGTVTVERRYPRGHQAVCTCGHLTTRRRLLRGFAVGDAYIHAAQTGCLPAQPLSTPHIRLA